MAVPPELPPDPVLPPILLLPPEPAPPVTDIPPVMDVPPLAPEPPLPPALLGAIALLTLEDGTKMTCRIIDMSLSGAAIAAENRPPLKSSSLPGKPKSPRFL